MGCIKKVSLREQSLEAKDRTIASNLGKDDVIRLNIREGRRGKQHLPHRMRRKDFEEDRETRQMRKLSMDISKKANRHTSPDHKQSIESEFS